MKIYATKAEKIGIQKQEQMIALLDYDRKNKIEHLRGEADRLRSIYAGLLLHYAFLEEGYTEDQWRKIEIIRGEHGKPALSGFDTFHYSLSHSGDWVICCVGKDEVGADIQEMKPARLQIAKRFFNPEEYERLITIDDDKEKEHAFYKMWSAKESYVKYTGRGLGGGISSCIISEEFDNILDMENDICVMIKIYENIDGYVLCGCAKNDDWPDEIEIIPNEQLI